MGLFQWIVNLIGRKKSPKLLNREIVEDNDTNTVAAHDISEIEIQYYLGPDKEQRIDEVLERAKKDAREQINEFQRFIDFQSEVGKKCSQLGTLAIDLILRISDTLEANYLKAMRAEERMEQKYEAKIAEKQLREYELAISQLKVETEVNNEALEKYCEQTESIKERLYKLMKIINPILLDKELDGRIQKERSARLSLKTAYATITQFQDIIKTKAEQYGIVSDIAKSLNVLMDFKEDEKNPQRENEILTGKQKELLEMANELIPKKEEQEENETTKELRSLYNELQNATEKEGIIEAIARLQNGLDLYAFSCKDKDIDKLKEILEEIKGTPKTEANRSMLLEHIRKLELRYKVFGRYITKEDWESLYRTKFDILMSDINKRQESPLLEVDLAAFKKEMLVYSEIIEEKIDAIMTDKNPELKRAFGEKVPEAKKIIEGILKGEGNEYNTYEILKDKNLLRLILAFDKDGGLEKLTINKDEIKDLNKQNKTPIRLLLAENGGLAELTLNDEEDKEKDKEQQEENFLNEEDFEWTDEIPIDTIYKIGSDYRYDRYGKIKSNENPLIELYRLYLTCNQSKAEPRDVHVIPRGVKVIKKFNDIDHIAITLINDINYDCPPKKETATLTAPTSLREIRDNAFSSFTNLEKINLQEGVLLGEDAFEGTKIQEVLDDASFVIPDELPKGLIDRVRSLDTIRRKLVEYVNTKYQEEMSWIKQQINKVNISKEKPENREQLLEQIEQWEKRCDIFNKYKEPKEYEKEIKKSLYELKLKVLVYQYYYNESNREKTLQGIEKIFQKHNLDIDVESILNLFTIDKNEIEGLTQDFRWADKIPVYSIFLIDKDPEYAGYKNSEIKTTNPMLQVLSPVLNMYHVYDLIRRKQGVHIIPNGILEIRTNMEPILEQLSNSKYKLVFPRTLKSITRSAFEGQENLIDVELPEGLINIDSFAFGMTGLKNVKLPLTLKTLGKGVFYRCEDLTDVYLPEGLETIDSGAFYGCLSLKQIDLPSSLKEIAMFPCADLFKYCMLDSISFKDFTGRINNNGGFGNLINENPECKIQFYEGEQKKPYLTIEMSEIILPYLRGSLGYLVYESLDFTLREEEFRKKLRKELVQDSSNINGYVSIKNVKAHYESTMQEMAKTDPEIARIWREYLKRRDGDKNEQKDDIQKSAETEKER